MKKIDKSLSVIDRIDSIVSFQGDKVIKIEPCKEILQETGNYIKLWTENKGEVYGSRNVESGDEATQMDGRYDKKMSYRNIPTLQGLCIYLGITTNIFNKISNPDNWDNNIQKIIAERLGHCADLIKDIKEDNLINRGLNKEYSEKITSAMLGFDKKEDKSNITNNFNFFAQARKNLENNN